MKMIEGEFKKLFSKNDKYKFVRGNPYSEWKNKVGDQMEMYIRKVKPGSGDGWIYSAELRILAGGNSYIEGTAKSKNFTQSIDGDLKILKDFIRTEVKKLSKEK